MGRTRYWLKGILRRADRWWHRFQRRSADRVLAEARLVELLPFRTHGSTQHLPVRGRLVLDRRLTGRGLRPAPAPRWRAMLRRYLVRHVAGAELSLKWRGPCGLREVRSTTDPGGYFSGSIPGPIPESEQPTWHEVEITRVDAPTPEAVAHVQVLGRGSRLGVVSDIDDTVVVTHAARFFSHLQTVMTHDPVTRSAHPGMAELYRALQAEQAAPFWYLSSSNWNLSDYWEAFFAHHGFPMGAMELREFGAQDVGRDRHRNHKKVRLEAILNDTSLPLLLVGDSGQADARIYCEVAAEQPDRIAAILIRDLALQPPGGPIHTLLRRTESDLQVPCRLLPDAAGMAQTLNEAGWLSEDALRRVQADG